MLKILKSFISILVLGILFISCDDVNANEEDVTVYKLDYSDITQEKILKGIKDNTKIKMNVKIIDLSNNTVQDFDNLKMARTSICYNNKIKCTVTSKINNGIANFEFDPNNMVRIAAKSHNGVLVLNFGIEKLSDDVRIDNTSFNVKFKFKESDKKANRNASTNIKNSDDSDNNDLITDYIKGFPDEIVYDFYHNQTHAGKFSLTLEENRILDFRADILDIDPKSSLGNKAWRKTFNYRKYINIRTALDDNLSILTSHYCMDTSDQLLEINCGETNAYNPNHRETGITIYDGDLKVQYSSNGNSASKEFDANHQLLDLVSAAFTVPFVFYQADNSDEDKITEKEVYLSTDNPILGKKDLRKVKMIFSHETNKIDDKDVNTVSIIDKGTNNVLYEIYVYQHMPYKIIVFLENLNIESEDDGEPLTGKFILKAKNW
jgi:hypothetical protein